MIYKLTQGQKNVVDTVLAILGAGFGYVLANNAQFGHYSFIAGIAGLAGGYFVSDAISYIDTGVVPKAQIAGQAMSLWQKAKPNLMSYVNNLNASDQAVAKAVITLAESELAKAQAS
ncbi:MAG: hypothetical protein ACYCQJ_15245 [Nitrososphaerales archaeon]